MPTDEERREVAERLRELAASYEIFPAWSAIAADELPTPIDNVLRACGLGRAVHAREICSRLAGLIEPEERTCDADLTDSMRERVAIKVFECSKCGRSWEQVWAYDFSYCPYCGRMIENADE